MKKKNCCHMDFEGNILKVGDLVTFSTWGSVVGSRLYCYHHVTGRITQFAGRTHAKIVVVGSGSYWLVPVRALRLGPEN